MEATCSSEILVYKQENTRRSIATAVRHHVQILLLISDEPVFQRRLTASLVGSPLNKTFLRQDITTNPALYNTGREKKYIYTLTNCSVRRTSAPVFGRRRGTEIGITPSLKRTLVEILPHMIFRPKYYLKDQCIFAYVGDPTLRPFFFRKVY